MFFFFFSVAFAFAFALEQNAIWLFSLIKGHKEKAHISEREREIRSLCTVADCTDKAVYILFMLVFVFSCLPEKKQKKNTTSKRLFPSFKRSCMPYMLSQTHPHTNTPINGCSQTPFVPQEFLCHLAQKWVLCHYCVSSIGSPPIHLSVSYFLILSLITGLQKAPNTKY